MADDENKVRKDIKLIDGIRKSEDYKKFVNTYGWAKNRLARIKRKEHLSEHMIEQQKLAKGLTNWQRRQWAKAGYPTDRLKYFSELTRIEPKNSPLLELAEEVTEETLMQNFRDPGKPRSQQNVNNGRETETRTSFADMLLRGTKDS